MNVTRRHSLTATAFNTIVLHIVY